VVDADKYSAEHQGRLEDDSVSDFTDVGLVLVIDAAGPVPLAANDAFSRSGVLLPVVGLPGTVPAVDFNAWNIVWVTIDVEVGRAE